MTNAGPPAGTHPNDHFQGDQMASNTNDYDTHERTYRSFLTLSKWAIGLIVVTLVVLYFVVNP